ncbi:MAG: gamma-glutamyltransferase [Gemmatimonadetes bacterium]|nr:gamma-glutamyltransferase [Gemmatimonadota bacterium]
MSRRLLACALLGALACSRTPTPGDSLGAGVPPRQAATFPAGWRFAAGSPAAFGKEFMIASNERRASDAGNEIIRAGGNAVDAAVAVGFALAVTYPVAGNIGGGGFMVIRMADGRNAAIDYREVAPLAAHRNMYLDAAGNPTNESIVGYRASGVPGAVAGMAEALAKYGTLTLSQVMQPAIRLARDGFTVDSSLHLSLASSRDYLARFDGKDVFFPNGQPLAVGSLFRQPALARSLEYIASTGPKAFYDGPVGDSLVAAMTRGGGIITREDLRRYTPEWRAPIRSSYRGYSLFTMPPASSGGITITEALNMLETWSQVPAWGRRSTPTSWARPTSVRSSTAITSWPTPPLSRSPSRNSPARRTRVRWPGRSTRPARRPPRPTGRRSSKASTPRTIPLWTTTAMRSRRPPPSTTATAPRST